MTKRIPIATAAILAAAALARCGSSQTLQTQTTGQHSHGGGSSDGTLIPMARGAIGFTGFAGASGPTGATGATGSSGTSGLPPEDPACANHSGDGGDCWGEWLKEPGNTGFAPVGKGQLGAGPWSTAAEVQLGTAQGLKPPILYAGVDTGENVYAVSDGALFIMRKGQSSFTEYDRGTNGLKDYPFLSVAGQAPGTAYVGHVGITPESEFNTPPTDPPELLKSGGIDKVVLTANGISVTPYWTHNSNSTGGSYSHDRTLFNLLVPRRGPAAGELYSTSEHCVTRRVDDTHYASHRHIEVDYGGSAHYGAARAVAVTDDGTMWYGSDFAFGALAWQPRLYEWYFDDPWLLPTNAYSDAQTQDWYRGIGVSSNGDVWAAAHGWGLAHLYDVDMSQPHATLETLNVPDTNMNTLAVDTDDSVWIGSDGGLHRYFPATKTWQSYPNAGGGINHVFLDDTVTPRALYVAGHDGLYVYRGQ